MVCNPWNEADIRKMVAKTSSPLCRFWLAIKSESDHIVHIIHTQKNQKLTGKKRGRDFTCAPNFSFLNAAQQVYITHTLLTHRPHPDIYPNPIWRQPPRTKSSILFSHEYQLMIFSNKSSLHPFFLNHEKSRNHAVPADRNYSSSSPSPVLLSLPLIPSLRIGILIPCVAKHLLRFVLSITPGNFFAE